MANIQPFNYQESTNIEEHNQIVNKVNEIVEVINNVNLDTINSEIANLKANATATDTEIANIKNKDTAQDTEIEGITKNLVSNVTATFDNPSRELKISVERQASPSIDATVVIPASSETGQYSAGNGITIDNYQIAVDTNVVALKTDIPVVPDVTELTQRVSTLETEMPTKASVDDVNSKVAIAQGAENAGKVLGIGADGNVTPVNAGGSSGGEVWEEIDLSNFPRDWAEGDMLRICHNVRCGVDNEPATWSNSPTVAPSIGAQSNATPSLPITTHLMSSTTDVHNNTIVYSYSPSNDKYIMDVIIHKVSSYSAINSGDIIIIYKARIYNAGGFKMATKTVSQSEVSTYFKKAWRCRASTQSP